METVEPQSCSSDTCSVKILKYKNKNSIRSELPTIAMLPKNAL